MNGPAVAIAPKLIGTSDKDSCRSFHFYTFCVGILCLMDIADFLRELVSEELSRRDSCFGAKAERLPVNRDLHHMHMSAHEQKA